MNVAIEGGGIGGMRLALSLHAAGFDDVDIYESSSTVKELGVGINLQSNAGRELTELGLLETSLAWVSPSLNSSATRSTGNASGESPEAWSRATAGRRS